MSPSRLIPVLLLTIIFQVVHSKFQDLLPKQIDDDDPSFERPDEEYIKDNTEKTRLALEKLVSGKIAAAMPVKAAEKQAPAQYIRSDFSSHEQ